MADSRFLDSGGGHGSVPTAGTSNTLPGVGGISTRQVSSWFFGDGAKLFNDFVSIRYSSGDS